MSDNHYPNRPTVGERPPPFPERFDLITCAEFVPAVFGTRAGEARCGNSDE